MLTRIEIKPEILTWAITRAGYDIKDFLDKKPYVKGWIDKSKRPTLGQLEKLSKDLYLPFGYLFLDAPPQENITIPFFRTTQGASRQVSLNVYDTITTLQRRQEWLSNYLSENDEYPLDFVSSFNENSGYNEIVVDIRKYLELYDDWAASFKNWEDALSNLVERIESLGIIVSFNGIVGNNTHRPVDVEECRGFVLVDSYAPFMYINAGDSKSAQMFTILHELAHIWIGKSAGFDFSKMLPSDDPVEKLSDMVAANFLVPESLFLASWGGFEKILFMSKQFKVSPIVIARRALDLNKITKAEFFKFYESHYKDYEAKKAAQASGGNFYATANKRLSRKFANYIDLALRQNQILHKEAYQLTGLWGDTYHTFIKSLNQ